MEGICARVFFFYVDLRLRTKLSCCVDVGEIDGQYGV